MFDLLFCDYLFGWFVLNNSVVIISLFFRYGLTLLVVFSYLNIGCGLLFGLLFVGCAFAGCLFCMVGLCCVVFSLLSVFGLYYGSLLLRVWVFDLLLFEL